MSTQPYYPPPNSYVPRPQAGQRQTMQYNPAGYNPAAYHPQAPPSPPVNVASQPGYNPNIYIPQHPVGPPGRMTPQPAVGAGGYVPYANLQGVIGGVNRSSALEQGGDEAPPPYSPPQRPFNRQMQPPNLQVPVNVQNNMFTPITPSNSYQPHSQSPLNASNPRQIPSQTTSVAAQPPPAAPAPTGYPVQDQRRVTSQPGLYQPTSISQPPAPVPAAAPQNAQYAPQRHSVAPAQQQQSFVTTSAAPQRQVTTPAAPVSAPARSPDDLEPTSPPSQNMPPTGSARERDSLPLRRAPPPSAETVAPSRRATMAIPPPPPAIPPPPSGPPPIGPVTRRQTMDGITNPPAPVQPPVASSSVPPSQTPTTGQSQIPTGIPLPPPPTRPPPKSVILQPAPLGKRRDKGKGVCRSDSISDDVSERGMASPPLSAPYSAGTLPFRRNSPPNSSTTPHSSVFPGSATIQPQSIMRSQKSSGDLASGGLRTTTPKDVRFVIPDDESEYDSTADGESQRNSGVEPSPGFVAAAAPTTPKTPGTPGRPRVSSQQIPPFATIAEEDTTNDDSKTKAYTGGWPNEKELLSNKTAPASAPATELRFHSTQTPPFSPESQKDEKVSSMNSQMNPPKTQAITPPMHSAPIGESKAGASSRVFPDDEPEDLDLPPFYHEAIERHTDMILSEATAPNDEKRLNVFVDFVLEEARMRGEMYNSALGILGAGLSLFPSDDPQYMTPEEQVAEFERREYEKRVIDEFATCSTPTGSSLKRRQTIKEQKARAGEYLENRRSRSNPSTPREPKRASWFENAAVDTKMESEPELSYPPEKVEVRTSPVIEASLLDIQPLLAIVPPYPRQFPASDNSHPSLQKTRKAIADLKDLKVIHKLKFDFTTTVPRIQDENAADARARKATHQDYIQRLFNEGRVTYEEMDRLTAEFERKEGDKKAEELQKEFDRFREEVVSPSHTELMDRIDKATSIMDSIQTDISSSAKANIGIREGPELLEKLNIMRTLFETREILYGEINSLIIDRDKRYKEVTIAPYLNEGDTEGIKEAEEFFADAAKQTKVTADKEAVERAKSFLDKVEKDVITGVESEVSNFWDVAPVLTGLLDKIPSELSNFKPIVPEDELYGNPNYRRFPLLYLKKKLDYVGNSIYQHAQAQMRLLDFSVEITLLWTNAKWALGDSERVLAGEEEQRAVWQVERQKKEEEVRQTKNWEEKVKIVQEEWSQSVGNKLSDIKKRIIDQLSQQEGWTNEDNGV
ncbi:hypothetical protein H072_7270 [Dactylellina haptotyla CBS 200.50]|uniref:Uncharacterized protein n=1 Tax=Dactylellina haptotyla (strain CBS 200.50) TaxID=1284197 RepID=S8A7J6_DACHA|nr:hypothetical protein H072_7270 [Dactylellina haptotyla CBS 200.50]